MATIGASSFSVVELRTFEYTRGYFSQMHFTVIEIDLPSVTGTCTISGEPGFGTPLSCDQPSNATTTYKFTQVDAPLLPESGILRLIKSINETPAKLNSGRGLSSRATGSFTMADITGKDPNPLSPAVVANGISSAGFLALLAVRNELSNKPMRIKNYRVNSDGTINLATGAETKHYIIDSMASGKNGDWRISFKDELSRVNLDETLWPIPLEGFLLNDITDIQTTFNVDANVTYAVADTIRIGDELMKISALANIGTGTANITVLSRGTAISYTNLLSQTEKSEHSSGDEIFICEVSDNETIDVTLKRILIDIGISATYIPDAAWAAEITEWHPSTFINTIWIESLDTFEALEMILTDYMIDMWFDPIARLIKISAISVWQESNASLTEGKEIDFQTISKRKEESLRSTRALVIYDKRFLASNDSIENYKKASLFIRSDLESADLFGEAKTKRFKASFLLNKAAADLLTNRHVNRFSNPFSFTWKTQENKLTFSTGDVVDVQDLTTVNFAGLPDSTERAQITSIKTNYGEYGRDYSVSALSYEPNFVTGTEILINGNRTDINLFNDYAGAPSAVVELTFIIDAATIGSSSNSIPAIRAGAFAAGSKVIIIMINSSDLQAFAGNGGTGETLFYEAEDGLWIRSGISNGGAGGVVYNADGITTDVYFSGATPSATYPTADGYIRAPSGGDGGFSGTITGPTTATAGDGGDGGDGRSPGNGGAGGSAFIGGFLTDTGDSGSAGNSLGTTSGFGNAGANNAATGGLAGSGILDSGATVTLYGSTAARYINGNGSHP
tara:strand:- start:3507 stop:5885 length:2379 start_codon:yes stop_codon:yes gene_type:complete